MRKIIILAFFLISFLSVFSQSKISVFQNEVKQHNGLTYFRGKLLTGHMYSNDGEREIPNDCSCTMQTDYLNGKQHGTRYEYYLNGKLKYKGAYKEGKPVGTHIFYNDQTGEIQESYYKDGKIQKEVTSKNGVILAEKQYKNDEIHKYFQYYSNNKPKIRRVYLDNERQAITEYYENGHQKKVEHLWQGQLHGDQIEYDTLGNKSYIKNYKNGKLIFEGGYQNDQQEGGWKYYLPNGNYKEKIYKSGQLVKETFFNLSNRIDHFPYKSQDKLVAYINNTTYKKHYYIIRVTDQVLNSDSRLVDIAQTLSEMLKSRALEPRDKQQIGKNFIEKIIKISRLTLETKPFEYETSVKNKNGQIVQVKKTGYKADISYLIETVDIDGTLFSSDTYFRSSTGSFGRNILNYALNNQPASPDAALQRAKKNLTVYKTLKKVFPYYTKIDRIVSDNKKRVKKVVVQPGNYLKNMRFAYFGNNNAKPLVVLKVISYDEKALCKVTEGGEWLKEHQNKLKELNFKEY